MQLIPGLHTAKVHLAAYKIQRLLREIVGGIDVPALQHG